MKQASRADALQSIERAIELLRQGETAAEAIFAEILPQRLQGRTVASEEAAEAARHLGAIAHLDNTAKAVEAYRTATELDPDDSWSWILLGRSMSEPGTSRTLRLAQGAKEVVPSTIGQALPIILPLICDGGSPARRPGLRGHGLPP